MAEMRIPCPHCGKQLKLPDRSLLGRKGRCPRCRRSFVLAETPADQAMDGELQPVEAASRTAETSVDQSPELTSNPRPRETADSNTADSNAVGGLGDFAALEQVAAADDGLRKLRAIKRRTARRRNVGIVVGAVVAAAVIGSYFAAKDYLTRTKPTGTAANSPQAALPSDSQRQNLDAGGTAASRKSDPQHKPISLSLIPTGAGLIINLHPAELWAPGSPGRTVRTGLGPLGQWADAAIRKYCLFEPPEIDEALICLILGARETPAEVAVVVHLTREHKRSELLERFEGHRVDDYGYPVYVTDSRAFLIADSKTFASAPKSMADDLVQARTQPGLPSGDLDELLAHTDRQRDLTVVFEPSDLHVQQDVLFPKTAHRLADALADWFGNDVEAVAWSVQLGRVFRSELLLRNKPIVPPRKVEREFKRKFDTLPTDILALVRKMNPTRQGPRKIIGRFPAMVEAYALETTSASGDRLVRLNTVLHERAAPNLAVATLLTWDESTRTNFDKPPKEPAATGPKLPARIAERLKRKIDIDFRRTPLQEAFAYIASETHVTIIVDGDALKLSGYTKNMPQTFKLGMVPATKILYEIVKQYDEMVLILDEKKKTLTVMTKAVAADKKLKPFHVGP